MPHDPNKDPEPFATDEEARSAALKYIRKLGKVLGHLLPHRSKPFVNDQDERIGVIYSGTKGKTVRIYKDLNVTKEELARGITSSYDVRPEGEDSTHFASKQRRRKKR